MRQSDLFIRQKRPWNAGRLIGPKAPLKPKRIWAIRQQLKVTKRVRDLAMFNCALDSKLRACDLVRLPCQRRGAGWRPSSAFNRHAAEDRRILLIK